MIDKKKLAVIHIVKKELGLSDAEYRDMLFKTCGVGSAKEIGEEDFRKLMNFFVRSKYYQVNQLGLTLRQKLYISHLVKELGWQEDHLKNFLHKYYHQPEVEKLTKKEAIKLIESLKHIQEHQKFTY